MRSLKMALGGLVLLIGLSIGFVPSVDAYTGGLLDGKPGRYSYTGEMRYEATDGNLDTGVGIRWGSSNIEWIFDEPMDIYQIRWNMSGMRLRFDAFNDLGELVGREQHISAGDVTREVNWKAVTLVRVVNIHTQGGSLWEFNVWGTLGPPPVPINLAATAGPNVVNLTWTASPGAESYNVYRNGDRINASPITTNSYTATGVSDNETYSWQVSAVRDGMESLMSSTVQTHRDTIPPNKINGVTATAGDKQVLIRWAAGPPSDGIAGYNVYRNGTKVNSNLITTTQHNVTGLVNGVSSSFTVTAVDQAGNESMPSDAVTAIPVDLTPPDKPINFRAVAGDKRAVLSWTANTEPDLTGYRLYNGNTLLMTFGPNATSYTVQGLSNDTNYTFRLIAIDTSGNESEPAVASVKPIDLTPPATPTNLNGSPGNGLVNLFWSANTEPDLRGYYIYRDGQRLNVAVNKDIYRSIGSLTNGTAYEFQISAVDLAGNESPLSNAVTITPDVNADSDPPDTPTGLTAVGNGTTIDATWDANTEPDLLGYFLYVDGRRATYAPISSNSHRLYHLEIGKTYSVAVSAIDTSGNESPLSAPVSVYIDVLAAPKDLRATKEQPIPSGISLTWTPTDPPPERYLIYRNGILIADSTGPPFLDNSVELGFGYRYQVAAERNGVESDRASVGINYSDKDIDFGGGGLNPAKDIFETGLSFLRKYGVWIIAALGVIFAPTIISFLIWMMRGFPKAPPKRGRGKGGKTQKTSEPRVRKPREPLSPEEKERRARERRLNKVRDEKYEYLTRTGKIAERDAWAKSVEYKTREQRQQIAKEERNRKAREQRAAARAGRETRKGRGQRRGR